MKRLKWIMKILPITLLCLLSGVVTYASTTYYSYNGVSSMGWYGSGSFNVASAGYDGSMYWKNMVSSSSSESYGDWQFYPDAGYYNTYVYIPNVYSNANVTYGVFPTLNGTAQGQSIGVDQINYSDQWVWLGQWQVDTASSGLSTLFINLTNYKSGVGTNYICGWDDAKISN